MANATVSTSRGQEPNSLPNTCGMLERKKLQNSILAALATVAFCVGQALEAFAVGYAFACTGTLVVGLLLRLSNTSRQRLTSSIPYFAPVGFCCLLLFGYYRAEWNRPDAQISALVLEHYCGIPSEEDLSGRELYCEIEGRVDSSPIRRASGLLKFELELESVPTKPRLALSSGELPWAESFGLSRGDVIRAAVRLRVFRTEPEHSWPISYEAYLLRRGVLGVARVVKIVSRDARSENPQRTGFVEKLAGDPRTVEVAGVMLASVSGDEALLGHEIGNIFRNAGLYHLIVVSGFHLVVIYGSLCFILRRALSCWLDLLHFLPLHVPVVIFALIGSGGYVLFTGSELATQRAWYALFLLGVSQLVFRKMDMLRCFIIVFFFTTFCFPGTFFEAGFQLTMSAVAGLMLSGVWVRQRGLHRLGPGLLRAVWGSMYNLFLVSAGPAILTLPVIIFWFESFSPLAVFYNVIFGTVFSGIFILAGGLVLGLDWFGFPGTEVLREILFSVGDLYLRLLELAVAKVEGTLFRFYEIPSNWAVTWGMLTASLALSACIHAFYLGEANSSLPGRRSYGRRRPEAESS